MKKFTNLILLLCLTLSVGAQYTFEWAAQEISPDNNLQEMNLVNDTTTILVGYGRTFAVSSDLGLTWNNVPILTPLYDFEDMSINASGLGYACAGDQRVVDNPSTAIDPDVYADGVFMTTSDYGATWTTVDITTIGTGEDPTTNPNADGCYARHFRSVEVLENNTVFVGIEWYFHDAPTFSRVSQAAVFKSTDGVTWTAITSDGNYPVAMEAVGTDIYFGGLNHLYKYESATETLTDIYANLILQTGGDATVYTSDITAYSSELIFIVTTTNGLYATMDQGANFIHLENGAPTGGNDLITVNDSVWMVLGTSTKSMATIDSGATWTACYPGATCYEIGGVLNDSIYGLGKSNIYKVAVADVMDGTFNWVSQPVRDNENLHKMHVVDGSTAIVMGYGETFVSTSDAGLSWTAVELPELFTTGAEYDFSAVSTSGTTSYACTRRLTMIDYPSSSDYSDVYNHGLIYKSTDYWKTWELLDISTMGTGDDPAFNPNLEGCYGLSPTELECLNDSTVLVYVTWLDTIAGVDNKLTHANVFKTTNSGESWVTLMEDLGSKYINDINFIDEDNGYIAGNTVFRSSTDGGDNLTDMYPAILSSASPDDSTIFINCITYIDENKWFLTSSTNGVFLTSDAGANYITYDGIGGGNGLYYMNDSTYAVVGVTSKTKLTWDRGTTWIDFTPGSSLWALGGILNDSLVALGKSNIYKIALADIEAPSKEADILSFELSEQTGTAVIDADNHTISIEVEAGTNVTALAPVITISEGAAISPASEETQDFTSPVTYTVTAEDILISIDWTVTVSIAVGLDEKEAGKLKAYPVPAGDILHLSNADNVVKVSIYSIVGKDVSALADLSNPTELKINNLSKGVYFIHVTDIEGQVSTLRFVKQ